MHAAAPCPPDVKRRRHRVLRTDPARVLRGQRRRRVLLHRLRGLAGAPRVGRQAAARRRPRRRRGRQGAAGRRGGPDLVRVVEPVRVPRRQAEDRRGVERPGLDDPRRRRLRRRRGLRVPHRPRVEHDHLRRREHLPPRDRGRAHRPPRGARRRRHRRPAPGDGRVGARGRAARRSRPTIPTRWPRSCASTAATTSRTSSARRRSCSSTSSRDCRAARSPSACSATRSAGSPPHDGLGPAQSSRRHARRSSPRRCCAARVDPGDAVVVDAEITTIGAGQMGICARYDLQLDRDVAGAPRSVVGKFAAEDEQARTFMASSGYPNEVCFYRDFASRVTIRVPRCAHAAIDDDGWFTLLLEDLSPMRPGDQLQGARWPRWRRRCRSSWACTRRCGTHRCCTSTRSSAAAGSPTRACSPSALQAVVPGFVERYGHAFAPDEVDFYERLADLGAWLDRGAPEGPQPRAQRLPARQPDVRHRRRRPAHGRRGRLAGLRQGLRAVRRVVRHRQRAHRRRPPRQRGAHRARLPRRAGRRRSRPATRSTSAGTSTGAHCSPR